MRMYFPHARRLLADDRTLLGLAAFFARHGGDFPMSDGMEGLSHHEKPGQAAVKPKNRIMPGILSRQTAL